MKARIIELTIALTIIFGIAACTMQKDATDPPNGRSNMGLRTDHQTGCQYLTNPRGGITPRMDSEGRHICREN